MKIDVLLQAWADWALRGENQGGGSSSRLNRLMAGESVGGGAYCSAVPVELLGNDAAMLAVDKAVSALTPRRRKVIRVEYLERGSHADKVKRFEPPMRVENYRLTLARAKINLQANLELKRILLKAMLK